jgi:hypothetical protein
MFSKYTIKFSRSSIKSLSLLFHRRSSLERINNRINNSFGFEKHYIRGKAKMQTRVGLAIAVMMAMALGHARAGRIGQMRSLVRPADKAA